MKTFLIIPAYNEASTIAQVISSARFYVDKIIVVDDGSFDRTSQIAWNSGAHVLRHIVNRGYGASLHTGSIWAISEGAQIIVHFDADGQHLIEDLPGFIEPILGGKAEAVLGSRFMSRVKLKPPLGRRILLRAAIIFTNVVSRINVTDAHNGFRAFRADSYGKMDLKQDRMAYSSEILNEIRRVKLSFLEVPTNIAYSAYSLKKGQNWTQSFGILWQLLRGRILR